MGRPIHSKHFDPIPDLAGGKVTLGGEGVASTNGNVAVTFSDRGAGYYTANAAVAFSAPQLPGGTTATGTLILFSGNGAIQAVSLVNAGTGYTTKPSLTFTGANATPAAGTITGSGLTAAVTNVLAVSAFIPTADGGSSAVVADIVKQVGAKRFKVLTAQGTGKCKLVAAAPAAGEMTITATDSQGSTYYVTKIQERRVTLTRDTVGGGWDYATGTQAKWIDTTTGRAATAAVAPSGADIGTVTLATN